MALSWVTHEDARNAELPQGDEVFFGLRDRYVHVLSNTAVTERQGEGEREREREREGEREREREGDREGEGGRERCMSPRLIVRAQEQYV